MKKHARSIALTAIAVAVWLAVLLVQQASGVVKADDYDAKLQAAQLMQQCMDAVKAYKQQRGIELSPLDIHSTGMIGEEFNGLTTTLGEIGAKRTTTHPDMAAMAVQLLSEAGVKRGDRVGLNLSGSFPAMNLAVLSACSVMELDVVCFAAVGSSTYGANNPGLSFPEMLILLMDEGLLPNCALTVTLGGDGDVGSGILDEHLVDEIEQRLVSLGHTPWKQPDFEANIEQRMNAYGDITCYIGVGGNITSIGSQRELNYQGYIPPEQQLPTLSDGSGLVELYHAQGVPVIHLLNIKQLAEDYSLPFDPVQTQQPGQSAVYYQSSYPSVIIIIALGVTIGFLAAFRQRGKRYE